MNGYGLYWNDLKPRPVLFGREVERYEAEIWNVSDSE